MLNFIILFISIFIVTNSYTMEIPYESIPSPEEKQYKFNERFPEDIWKNILSYLPCCEAYLYIISNLKNIPNNELQHAAAIIDEFATKKAKTLTGRKKLIINYLNKLPKKYQNHILKKIRELNIEFDNQIHTFYNKFRGCYYSDCNFDSTNLHFMLLPIPFFCCIVFGTPMFHRIKYKAKYFKKIKEFIINKYKIDEKNIQNSLLNLNITIINQLNLDLKKILLFYKHIINKFTPSKIITPTLTINLLAFIFTIYWYINSLSDYVCFTYYDEETKIFYGPFCDSMHIIAEIIIYAFTILHFGSSSFLGISVMHDFNKESNEIIFLKKLKKEIKKLNSSLHEINIK